MTMETVHFFVLAFDERRSFTSEAFAGKVVRGQSARRKRVGQWIGRCDHRSAEHYDTQRAAQAGAQAFLQSEHAKDYGVKVVRIVQVERTQPTGCRSLAQRRDTLSVVSRVVSRAVPIIERVGLLDGDDLEDTDA